MFEGLKRFVFANFVLFMVILIVLPPVGVILFGLFFYVIPLWILLTDRPTRWTRNEDE